MSEQQPFRIGLVCHGSHVPQWQARCIRNLEEQRGIEVVGIAHVPDSAPARRIRDFFEMRLGGALFPKSGKLVPIDENIRGHRGRHGEDSKSVQAVIEELRAKGASAILSFLFEQVQLPGTTSIPIWRFDIHGQGLGPNGLPRFRTWMLREQPVTADLISTNGGSMRAVFNDRAVSGGMDMDSVMFGAAWLPVAMARAKEHDRWTGPASVERTSAPPFPILLLRWARTELRNTFSGRRRSAIAGEWNIGVYPHPIATLLEDQGNTNVRWLNSPSPGSHRSEPFGYRATDGQLNVLYRKGEGVNSADVIARVRPRNDGILKRSRTMLSTVADLGYPFVIERPDGAYVLISYLHQQRTELFRVAEDNDTLDHMRTVLDRAIVNPTCVSHEGRWWLFGTDPEAPDGVLHAFHASEFDGPYTPHRHDPVKMTGSGCRPAGTFFYHDGSLWRPSVDNTDPLALGVIFNRVVELDADRYHEEAQHTLPGFPRTTYNKGIRTVCAMGDITLVDGIRPAPEAREMEAADSGSLRKPKEYLEE